MPEAVLQPAPVKTKSLGCRSTKFCKFGFSIMRPSFETENGEMVVAIQPDLCRPPSRRFGQRREDIEIIFARTFGVNGFAGLKCEVLAADGDLALIKADEMHLDGGFAGVPARFMREAVERKVAVELPVDPRQKIEVEGRRHAVA